MKRPASIVILLIVFSIFVILLFPRVMHVEELKSRSRALEEEVKQIRQQNRVLELELKLLKEDPVYLEKVARQKLNKAKPGEIVYKISRDSSSQDKG